MQGNRQLARDGDLGFLEAGPFREPHALGLKCAPFLDTGQKNARRFEQVGAHHPIAAFRDAAGPVGLARGMAPEGNRADAARVPVISSGAAMQDLYMTLGTHELVSTSEARDDAATAKFALKNGPFGNVNDDAQGLHRAGIQQPD